MSGGRRRPGAAREAGVDPVDGVPTDAGLDGLGDSTEGDAAVSPPGTDDAVRAVAADRDDALDESSDEARLARYAAALGVRFRDLDLLRLALTHRSVAHDAPAAEQAEAPVRSNERLEFLGDAVLGAIAADFLYAHDPDANEGTLTARRVALVRAETLVGWAREIDLASQLRLGSGERVSESARDRMLAGAFEAVVGAIWLDRGWAATRRFLHRFLARDAPRVIEQQAEANPKGRLQEVLQERFRLSPAYRTVTTEGPAHARVFTVEVGLEGRPLGLGVGGSKREAQQAAAAAALALLETTDDPLAPAAGPALAHADRPSEAIVPPSTEGGVASDAGGAA